MKFIALKHKIYKMFATDVIAIISVFTTILTIALMYFKTRHTERMALIDSGADANVFYPKKRVGGSLAFKLGCLLTGVGIGFFFGMILESIMGLDSTVIAPLIMIGGGVGLIVSHILDRRFEKEEEY